MGDARTYPEETTVPCSRFLEYERELTGFVLFFTRSATRPDEMFEDFLKVLYDMETDEAKKQEYKQWLDEPKQGRMQFRRFVRLLLEMTLIRAADNFLTYISELLALVFTGRPETLKSAETVKLEEILKYASMEELVHALSERRVERLSYQGMRELERDLTERLGFHLFPEPNNLSRAVRIIEMRNLISHNRGVVNRNFQRKTGDTSQELGAKLALEVRALFSDVEFLAGSVIDIDERAAVKFNLQRVKNNVVPAEPAHPDMASGGRQ